jgi:hypothetical protein
MDGHMRRIRMIMDTIKTKGEMNEGEILAKNYATESGRIDRIFACPEHNELWFIFKGSKNERLRRQACTRYLMNEWNNISGKYLNRNNEYTEFEIHEVDNVDDIGRLIAKKRIKGRSEGRPADYVPVKRPEADACTGRDIDADSDIER